MLEINRAQADVPDPCEVIPNKLGTAPIMVFRFPAERFGHKAVLYSMPGVPFETIAALDDVLEDIKAHFDISDIFHYTLNTFGMAESALSRKIASWEDSLDEDMHLAYLPNPLSGVRLRLSIYGGERSHQEERAMERIRELKEILGKELYYEGDSLAENIGKMLLESGKTVSAAESCTGGLISALFTQVAGCSSYYLGSVTSYANSVKTGVLGVDASVIESKGAVSEECVRQMAAGVRRLTGSDFAVATSGIAGPGGGTKDKPVGLVWIGISSERGTNAVKMEFKSDRKHNIERFAANALNELRKLITKELNY